jgi:large subunit ribosomal protein L9
VNVILLSDVEKLGLRGDVVTVANGYARNYLLPRKLAERATPGRVAELRRRDERRARHEAATVDQARQIADVLGQTELRFDMKAGPTGALFGSVTPTDVADEIWRLRKIRVDRRKIDLHDPIKRIGRYEVPIELFADVSVAVKTLVVPEGGELPPEEEAPPVPEDEAATGLDAVAEATEVEAASTSAAEAPEPAEGEPDETAVPAEPAASSAAGASSEEPAS